MTDPLFDATIKLLSHPSSTYGKTPVRNADVSLDLQVGEARYPLPPTIRSELGAALEDLDRIWYSAPAGDQRLREKYISCLQPLKPVEDSDVETVLVTSGGKEAAWLAMRYLLSTNRAGSVLVPRPGWEPYTLWLKAAGASYYGYDPAALAKDPQILIHAIEQAEVKPSLLVMNYPNSPTGITPDQTSVNSILTIATKNGLSVLSDEVYRSFSAGNVSIVNCAHYNPLRHLVVDSCSKWLAVAGLRVGFLVAAPTIVADLASFRASYASCTSIVTQAIALTLISSPSASCWTSEVRSKIQDTRLRLVASLERNGVATESHGGLYIWIPRPSEVAAPHGGPTLQARLSDGAGFGRPGYTRVCAARADLDVALATAAIQNSLRGGLHV